MKENVGSQDQVAVAFGGLNKISFNEEGVFRVEPMTIKKERIKLLQDNLMLVYTGLSRYASRIAKEQIRNTRNKKAELTVMRNMVDEAVDVLNSERDINGFGRLLSESWKFKKSLSEKISNPTVDAVYDNAVKAGAIGGKLLGAGGGGFMLFFVPPARRRKVKNALNKFLEVGFSFENEGSQIIYYG